MEFKKDEVDGLIYFEVQATGDQGEIEVEGEAATNQVKAALTKVQSLGVSKLIELDPLIQPTKTTNYKKTEKRARKKDYLWAPGGQTSGPPEPDGTKWVEKKEQEMRENRSSTENARK